MLDEIGLLGTQSDTYKLANKLKEEVIDDVITPSRKFDLELQYDFETLPIKYWLPKLHMAPTGASFIVAFRTCSTKALSKAVIKSFKLISKQIHSFQEKLHLYSDYKRFCVVENSKPVIDRLDQINSKQNARLISTFDFSTLYIKLPHKDLLKVLFGILKV